MVLSLRPEVEAHRIIARSLMDRAASAIWSIIRAVDVLQDLAGTEYTSMSSAAPPLEPVLLEVEEEEAPPRLDSLPAEPLRQRLA